MALTALDFPASPTNGQLYPDPPVTGQPQYSWNGTQWLSSKAAVTQIARTDALGWSGMQVNGSMEVSQEYGSTVIGGISDAAKYIADGWILFSVGSQVMSALRDISNPPPGFSKVIQTAPTTANPSPAATSFCSFIQYIEGYRIARLGWGTANAKPITLGFWVLANRTGTYSGAINSGIATVRSYVFTFAINASNVWEYKTITIPGDTAGTWGTVETKGMTVAIFIMAGTSRQTTAGVWANGDMLAATGTTNGVAATSDIFRLTGVVVLPGIEAPTAAQSPLIMRPYDQELLTCQRYYRQFKGPADAVGWAQAYATTGAQVVCWFEEMRAAPTLTAAGIYALTSANTTPLPVASITGVAASLTSITANCAVGSGLVAGDVTKLYINGDATARFKIDARL
jgi:hypothetical protein